MKLTSSAPKIGIIGGGNLYNLSILKKTKPKRISTPYGEMFYYLVGNCPLILRHGLQKNIPPHRVNYLANISAFRKLKKKFIFAFNSVGSLKKSIKPGDFLAPSDFIGFNTLTFFDRKCRFITPEISPRLRKVLIKILKNLKFKFKNEGIYFETRGPRLETKAEISLIKNFADVVGMTMAKEATLAKELDLEYASVCSVDNYAHGIIKAPLSEKEIKENQLKMGAKTEKIIEELLKLKSI